jgi:ubiquinone/menaquinone biosynthesis C-methylase UbiE
MGILQGILMRMFGHPRGLLGRAGGVIMARMNAACGVWAAGLLDIGPDDSVLEVGFGPGVVIRRLSDLASTGRVAGVDLSRDMLAQARARNAAGIRSGRIDLRQGSVEGLPFDDDSFDKALAINAMHLWPDRVAGLIEMRRVLKPGGRVALGFTPYSGQPNQGLAELLTAAGFVEACVVEKDRDFCALAAKPAGA